jgi:hypothetical protein
MIEEKEGLVADNKAARQIRQQICFATGEFVSGLTNEQLRSFLERMKEIGEE